MRGTMAATLEQQARIEEEEAAATDTQQRQNHVGAAPCSSLDGSAPEGTDFANYFCTYAYLYHQKDMLEDHKRTGAYYNAVAQNRQHFVGKVVLDVGTGSGILAIFAARAGARKVYAVEATAMAQHARQLVVHNKLEGVVEVIQGMVESVELPEKVDIIISEWMGYFLLRESMLDSVLLARDRFLAPGGALYPSHARMFLAPVRTSGTHQRVSEFQGAMEGWAEFVQETHDFYGVDMACLSDAFRTEQKDYYLHTSQWCNTHPSSLLGPPVCFKRLTLATTSLDELRAPMREHFRLPVIDGGPVEGFVGFFDVAFAGARPEVSEFDVRLGTGPDPTGCSHWGQQCFFVHPPIDCAPGDAIEVDITLTRRADNQRLLNIVMATKVVGTSIYAEQHQKERLLYFQME